MARCPRLGNGTTTPSTLDASGASVSETSSFFTIGTYTVSLTVTDKDGAVGAQALIDAGLITPSTTGLDLTGELSNGVQVISRIPFTVH